MMFGNNSLIGPTQTILDGGCIWS